MARTPTRICVRSAGALVDQSCASKYIPGELEHESVLQEPLSTAEPGQVSPPFDGTGLSHTLVLVFIPPPQVTEQEAQLPHGPQFPLTANKNETINL